MQEYHARIAEAYETEELKISNAIALAARHYSLAGELRLEKAISTALSAATYAILKDIGQMKYFLDSARRLAQKTKWEAGVEQEILLVECDASHLVGYAVKNTAERGQDFLRDHGGPGLPIEVLIKVTRAVYDAIKESDKAEQTGCSRKR